MGDIRKGMKRFEPHGKGIGDVYIDKFYPLTVQRSMLQGQKFFPGDMPKNRNHNGPSVFFTGLDRKGLEIGLNCCCKVRGTKFMRRNLYSKRLDCLELGEKEGLHKICRIKPRLSNHLVIKRKNENRRATVDPLS